MRETRDGHHFVTLALALAISVPFIYYGIQAAAAPSFLGFSLLSVTASELGSDRSPAAYWFNSAIKVQGVITIIAAFGFLAALVRAGVPFWIAALTSAAVAMNGVQTLWAGWFPMPDPRHGGHPAFIVGMLATPVLLGICMWLASRSKMVRWYFVLNLVLLAACVPFMSGATGLDLNNYRGLMQRVFTLAIFPPIAVAAIELIRIRIDRRTA